MSLTFFIETFVLGLKNLRLHKLRSLLTALGIILGTAAVIVMVAIGEGGKQQALDRPFGNRKRTHRRARGARAQMIGGLTNNAG